MAGDACLPFAVEVPLTVEMVVAGRGVTLDHRGPVEHCIAASAPVPGLSPVTAGARLPGSQDIAASPDRPRQSARLSPLQVYGREGAFDTGPRRPTWSAGAGLCLFTVTW